jgi:hypothetical protein
MSKKQQDLLKAKQKKQKIIVVVGGVFLLALLAFQVPRMMKQMNSLNGNASASSSAATTTTASTTPAPAGTPPADGSLTPPTLSGPTTASTTPASSSGLADSDPAPAVQDGQLVSFSRFIAKDPFSQQIEQNPTSGDSGKTGGGTKPKPGKGSGDGKPVPPSASGGSGDGGSGDGGSTTPKPPAADPTKATISINGVSEDVQIGGAFPTAQPYFKLVSLESGEARIGIAGGSLAGGDQTVALVKGKKLTLQNTADGTRYELVLVSTA